MEKIINLMVVLTPLILVGWFRFKKVPATPEDIVKRAQAELDNIFGVDVVKAEEELAYNQAVIKGFLISLSGLILGLLILIFSRFVDLDKYLFSLIMVADFLFFYGLSLMSYKNFSAVIFFQIFMVSLIIFSLLVTLNQLSCIVIILGYLILLRIPQKIKIIPRI